MHYLSPTHHQRPSERPSKASAFRSPRFYPPISTSKREQQPVHLSAPRDRPTNDWQTSSANPSPSTRETQRASPSTTRKSSYGKTLTVRTEEVQMRQDPTHSHRALSPSRQANVGSVDSVPTTLDPAQHRRYPFWKPNGVRSPKPSVKRPRQLQHHPLVSTSSQKIQT